MAEPRPRRVTFLSDFGYADEFVGVVHSVLVSVCPEVDVVDLAHEVPPHDVRAGAAMLERAVPYVGGGVVLGVVDPGVGGARRPVVVEAGPLVMVGPDNGLLLPAAAALGGVTAAVEAAEPRWWLPRRSGTFDARDVFGPVAAHLAAGVPVAEFGPPVDPASLVRLSPPVLDAGGDRVVTEVVWVDRFGNVALSAGPAEVDPLGGRVTVRAARPDGPAGAARRVETFSELAPGELGLLIDSSGRAALVLDRAPASTSLSLRPGDRVVLARA